LLDLECTGEHSSVTCSKLTVVDDRSPSISYIPGYSLSIVQAGFYRLTHFIPRSRRGVHGAEMYPTPYSERKSEVKSELACLTSSTIAALKSRHERHNNPNHESQTDSCKSKFGLSISPTSSRPAVFRDYCHRRNKAIRKLTKRASHDEGRIGMRQHTLNEENISRECSITGETSPPLSGHPRALDEYLTLAINAH